MLHAILRQPITGAGTITETIKAQTPLIVVVNEALMDNHQIQLAEGLASQGLLIASSTDTQVHRQDWMWAY